MNIIENKIIIADWDPKKVRWDTVDDKGNDRWFRDQLNLENYYGQGGWILSTIVLVNDVKREFHFHRTK